MVDVLSSASSDIARRDMTPSERRAYNAGIEAARELALAEIAKRRAYPKLGLTVTGIMAGASIVEEGCRRLLLEMSRSEDRHCA